MDFQEACVWVNGISERLLNEMEVYAQERKISFRAVIGLQSGSRTYTVAIWAKYDAIIEYPEDLFMRPLYERCLEVLSPHRSFYLGSAHWVNVPVAGMEACLVTMGLLNKGDDGHRKQYNAWVEKYFPSS